MGLRWKVVILLSALLVGIVGFALLIYLPATEARLISELERHAGILSRAVRDDVAHAIESYAEGIAYVQALAERTRSVPGIAWAAVFGAGPEQRVIAHSDPTRVGEEPSPVHRDAVAAVGATGEGREIPPDAPGSPSLLVPVLETTAASGPRVRAVVMLALREDEPSDRSRPVAQALASALADGVGKVLDTLASDERQIQETCERFAELDDVAAVEVFDEDARIVAHSQPDRIGGRPSAAHRRFVLGLYRVGGTRVDHSRETERYNRFVAVYAGRNRPGGPPAAVIEISMDTRPIRAEVVGSQTRLALLLLLFFVAGGAGLYWALGRLVLGPIDRLSEATRAVAAGDFERHLEVGTADEVGHLARNFNRMVDRLRHTTVSRDFMENVVDSMSDGLFITDADGRIRHANAAAHRIVGMDEGTLEGERLNRFLQVEAAERAGASAENVVVRADGGRVPVLASRAELRERGERRPGSVWVLKDITARVKAQAELAQSQQALERAQRLEAVGRLAGGVAHDLNNVLTAILGHADFLLRSLDPGGRPHHDAQEVRKAADRAVILANQLLAIGRRQVLHPRVLDLNAVIEDLLGMVRRLTGQEVDVVTLLTPDLGAVSVDPVRIEQVIVNLVVNARDAMPQGGRLTIETGNVDVSDADADRLELGGAGPHVMLAVEDSGVGIDEETRAHMFEPFFTTKAPGSGTGLGLSTVHGIVKQSGGSITCESRPGHGTRFVLLFPRAADAPPAPSRAGGADEAGQAGANVLLVDDDKGVRQFCRRFLESCGYGVIEAENGEGAVEYVRAQNGSIDLVISDVVLPGIRGPEVVRSLRAMRAELPAILITAYAGATSAEDARALGAGFLQKPFTGHELVRAVRAALR